VGMMYDNFFLQDVKRFLHTWRTYSQSWREKRSFIYYFLQAYSSQYLAMKNELPAGSIAYLEPCTRREGLKDVVCVAGTCQERKVYNNMTGSANIFSIPAKHPSSAFLVLGGVWLGSGGLPESSHNLNPFS
jgi:hypothetical protein